MRVRKRSQPELKRFARSFRALILCCVPCLAGCASALLNSERLGVDAEFEQHLLTGDRFKHLIYSRRGQIPSQVLHVYLSGDGSPWIGRTRISSDPTPRNPVALRLMSMDPNPSLYLGRPCYHGLAHTAGCDASRWTYGRYSEQVVASLTKALQGFVHEHGYREIVLIGYSGGGVLAWLMAERLGRLRLLVTIAANLDIDAWTNLHGYTPLHDSLNPANRPPLPTHIRQLHVVGTRDTNVPPSLTVATLTGTQKQILVMAKPVDHRCCWERLWPDLLHDIQRLGMRPLD
jgi:predicted esterase YcpF (UPF0227 family)